MSSIAPMLGFEVANGEEEAMEESCGAAKGARDFDFLIGRWRVRHRRLRERLAGSTDWDEFTGRCVGAPLPAGIGNWEENTFHDGAAVTGLAFRFFDPASDRWAIFWIDNRRRVLDPPVVGAFDGDRGVFLGEDRFDGRPIRVRFVWSCKDPSRPRWEQAFSQDGGTTWETNWVMEFEREREGAGGAS